MEKVEEDDNYFSGGLNFCQRRMGCNCMQRKIKHFLSNNKNRNRKQNKRKTEKKRTKVLKCVGGCVCGRVRRTKQRRNETDREGNKNRHNT